MDTIISYIISFLLGHDENSESCKLVGYTSDRSTFHRYKVVIIPSPFFEKNVYSNASSLPKTPLQEVEGVPLLYGSSKMEWVGDTWVVHADIIASTFFLITRYEELLRPNIRDSHGRFPGKESLPFRAGFVHRPIVDEYGKLLYRWLHQARVTLNDPPKGIHKIYLTHDVDAPFYCRTLRNIVRETLKGKGLFHAINMYFSPLTSDPYYTFPWFMEQDKALLDVLGKEKVQAIYFFKANGGKDQEDKPIYNLYSKNIQLLLQQCKSSHATIGLHSSYEAGKHPLLITEEKKELEKATKELIKYNRHHFLSIREPEDYDILEKAEITDDFTMGYADVAGFRLGTCRPVRWINPKTKQLSPLILHPLTIMECSLSEPNYMNLKYEEALTYCLQLAKQVATHNGEFILLWHNDTITSQVAPALSVKWQQQLYQSLINELKKT